MKLSAIQMVSNSNVEDNLSAVERFLDLEERRGTSLYVLPECFGLFGVGDKKLFDFSANGSSGLISAICKLAKKYGVWMVAGTIPMPVATHPDKFSAACLLIDDSGLIITRYNKIHLFDVDVADSTKSYRESTYTKSGHEVVVAKTPFGRIGIAVCYDLRFPGLFQAMGQVDCIVLPSAFTKVTGEAHWHTLLGARSIENQCYVVAANQGGKHQNGRETFGHTSIYSPWGELLGCKKKGEGLISCTMDFELLRSLRASMPIARHNNFESKAK